MQEEQRLIEKEKELLQEELNRAQEEMAAAFNQFQVVVEPDLIDYYTYAYKASMVKHNYLIKKLKKLYYQNEE
nr:DUF2508 family protein [uncultured Cellulosilyticum sp.]